MTRLLSGTEAAKRLGMSRDTFYKLPDSKKPPVTIICRRKMYNEASLEKWLLEREKKS